MLVQVDDAIGDLAGGRYYNKETVAAITIGMGTNAAYVETAPAVPKWNDPWPKSGELVNIYNATNMVFFVSKLVLKIDYSKADFEKASK